MKKQYPDLPGWTFEMEEVSASVYEAVGRDRTGHCVSAKGVDPDKVIDECKQEARKVFLRRNAAAK
jgi:hypothetical protein